MTDIQSGVTTVEVTDEALSVGLADGRIVSVPLKWYPRLLHATEAERKSWCVFEDSDGLVVLTNGFAKKTQKTPDQEIELAQRRRRDYLTRRRQ